MPSLSLPTGVSVVPLTGFSDLGHMCDASPSDTVAVTVQGLNVHGDIRGAVPDGWSLVRAQGETLIVQRHSVKRRARALSFARRKVVVP